MMKIFVAQEFCYGDRDFEGCKNVGVEGVVNLSSISHFCESDLI